MLTLKESTRWLTHNGRHDEAWESLVWVRGSDNTRVAEEMDEIRVGVDYEIRETEGFKFSGAFQTEEKNTPIWTQTV